MATTIYNTAKQRLETLEVERTDENTTWFDDDATQAIGTITDLNGGLLIDELNYNYPIWVDGVSRADIKHSRREAKSLLDSMKTPGREK